MIAFGGGTITSSQTQDNRYYCMCCGFGPTGNCDCRIVVEQYSSFQPPEKIVPSPKEFWVKAKERYNMKRGKR